MPELFTLLIQVKKERDFPRQQRCHLICSPTTDHFSWTQRNGELLIMGYIQSVSKIINLYIHYSFIGIILSVSLWKTFYIFLITHVRAPIARGLCIIYKADVGGATPLMIAIYWVRLFLNLNVYLIRHHFLLALILFIDSWRFFCLFVPFHNIRMSKYFWQIF